MDISTQSIAEFWQAFLDVAPAGVALFDRDMRYIQVSARWKRDYGLEGQDIIGRSHYELFPDLPERWKDVHRRCLNGAEESCDEDPFPRADGKLDWVRWQVRPWHARFGKIGGIIIFSEVVTERVVAQRALKDSEASYRALVEQQISGIAIVDAEACFAYVNPQLAKMVGRTVDELIGRPVLEVVTERERAVMMQNIARQLAGEVEFVQLDSSVQTKTGEIRDVFINATRSTWKGRPAATATLLDVTERRRVTEALRRSERKYRTTVDMAPVGIVQVGVDGRFLMVNEFFCKLLGYGSGDLLKMSVVDVTLDEDRSDTLARINRSPAGPDGVEKFVKRYRHRDGHPVWVEVSYSRETDPESGENYDVGIIADITERRRSEEDRIRFANQLQQSQKMEAIGQLTGGMAHDFNNLLAVILGNLERLREEYELSPEALQYIDGSMAATLKGAELTRSLLAFASRQPLAPKITNVGEVIRQAGSLFLRTLGENIRLELKIGEGLWLVLVDVAQLESALLNLAVNSRDAMPAGGKLTLAARNETLDEEAASRLVDAAPGDFVTISVCDTGTGMPPEVVAKIFDPFFTTKGAGGSGLGLSMVHGFVKQTGGHTQIQSEVGKGTTVEIYLPRADGSAGEAADERGAPNVSRGHETVMVVEDNDALRQLAAQRLGRQASLKDIIIDRKADGRSEQRLAEERYDNQRIFSKK